jgi:multidrug efflux system membrane fusion protein
MAGLSVGEKVVTEGGDRLRDGAKVQLPDAAARPAAAGASATGNASATAGMPGNRGRGQNGQPRKHPRPEAQ